MRKMGPRMAKKYKFKIQKKKVKHRGGEKAPGGGSGRLVVVCRCFLYVSFGCKGFRVPSPAALLKIGGGGPKLVRCLHIFSNFIILSR